MTDLNKDFFKSPPCPGVGGVGVFVDTCIISEKTRMSNQLQMLELVRPGIEPKPPAQ